MKKSISLFAIALSVLFVSSPLLDAQDQDMKKGWISDISNSKSKKEAVKKWRDMGFGIFMHWTPAIVFQGRAQGREKNTDLWGEWYMGRTKISPAKYEQRIKTWNPKNFNADTYAKLFKKSGAKYFVFVAKHHDGFSMFDSKANDYDIIHNNKFHRDVFGELAKACRKYGIDMGFYYSHGTDWRNKSQFKGTKEEKENQYWEKIAYKHLNVLTKNYGPQAVAWFDLGAPGKYAKKCVEIVKKNCPNIMVSSRIGGKLGDFELGGDCDIPPKKKDAPWETCMTFDWHWDWYPAGRADKSSKQLIQMLAKIRARGGNLLLNIGPDIRGNIPLRETVTLTQMGEWLAENGESIYGVRPAPYNDLPWGVCTQKPGKLFLHLFKLPRLDYLFLPGLKSEIKNAYILTDKKKAPLKFKKVPYGYKIYLRGSDYTAFNDADTVITVEYTGTLEADNTPVLDQDLENRFLPALAKMTNKASFGRTRITPKPDNPGIEAPHYYNYAWNFTNPKGAVSWKCIIPNTNSYFVKLKYANLTDKILKANIKVGDKQVQIELPPTSKNGYASFQTAICKKAFILNKNNNADIVFTLDKSTISNELGKKGPMRLRNFMLEWVEVSTLAPPLYEGYSETKGL
jgi:alpha-L-fucosidase